MGVLILAAVFAVLARALPRIIMRAIAIGVAAAAFLRQAWRCGDGEDDHRDQRTKNSQHNYTRTGPDDRAPTPTRSRRRSRLQARLRRLSASPSPALPRAL